MDRIELRARQGVLLVLYLPMLILAYIWDGLDWLIAHYEIAVVRFADDEYNINNK